MFRYLLNFYLCTSLSLNPCFACTGDIWVRRGGKGRSHRRHAGVPAAAASYPPWHPRATGACATLVDLNKKSCNTSRQMAFESCDMIIKYVLASPGFDTAETGTSKGFCITPYFDFDSIPFSSSGDDRHYFNLIKSV